MLPADLGTGPCARPGPPGRGRSSQGVPGLDPTASSLHTRAPGSPEIGGRAEIVNGRGQVIRKARCVEKPWGHELVWAETDTYVGKVLHIRAGEALSLQYHERKDETIYILRGRLRLLVGPSAPHLEELVLEEGEGYHIPPGTVHRMEADLDCDVAEASTPQLDDLVRLEDRYGRVAR